ncbi:hypothetical protein K1719_016665 [Acacia pycnantha]|nr:hypothetical protein K1719_016665 [Acacia pycnantha]
MDKTETSFVQKNWSQSDGEEEGDNFKSRKDLDVSLPFCFVTIWPKDATFRDLFKEAIKMFKKKDQQHLQLSEKIREKVLERELVIGRLEDLRYNLRKLNLKISEIGNAKRATTEDVDSHAECDEVMEKKMKEKQTFEAKIKDVEKEFEDIKEEIWSHVEDLKVKHHRNEASVCMLDQHKNRGKFRWFFSFCDLESIHTGFTSMNTSSNTL